MPFPFELPTTGSINLNHYLASRSHPSLPALATSQRSVVKDVLKRYKRLSPSERTSQLSSVDNALQAYLPYLLLLDSSTAANVSDIQTARPLQVEWRSTLSSTLPGREAPRLKVTGIAAEIAFTLVTLARTRYLMSRPYLKSLQDGSNLTSDQRTAAVAAASKHLLEAYSISKFALSLPSIALLASGPIDVHATTISGLAMLAIAEANLIFVAKDDPYAAAVADDRNTSNTDWMYKAPSIPKVRATLYARICIAAADHASRAHAAFAGGKINDDLVAYSHDLRKTARAKAIRLLAINAEAAGNTGEALAWINAAKKELGVVSEIDGKRKGLRGWKQQWQERREDRKLEQGNEWGLDAGRLEEARIVQMLEAKWDKENSTINVQIVPPFEPLLQQLPSGRDALTPQPWSPPILDDVHLISLRAPADVDLYQPEEEDSGAEDLYNAMPNLTIGGFHEKDSTNTYY